ncbi:MAG: hypothetical protein JSS79_04670 [Bacteroidetes bacterium]|jgi:hypothetical protein|nr:hypothetical protein [Bacteroidota bacterium]
MRDIPDMILQRPIAQLPLSEEFKRMAEANGFQSLNHALKFPLSELPFKKRSGYRLLAELLQFLEAEGLSECVGD